MSLTALRSLISPLTGIIIGVSEAVRYADEPPVPVFACELASGLPVIGADTPLFGSGSGYTKEQAEAAAVGEAVERYSASYVPPELPLCRAAELPGAIAPQRFGLFSTRQYERTTFPFRPFGADTVVRWVKGQSLHDGREAYAPAQLVYMAHADEPVRITYGTSSGLACGSTFGEAAMRAMFEVVERDAFVITWCNRLAMPIIDASRDPIIGRIHDAYFSSGYATYRAIDLSRFSGVPTVLAVVRDRYAGVVPLAIGAASARTAREAWLKAVLEAFHTRSWVRNIRQFRAVPAFRDDFTDVASFEDHVLFYTDGERCQGAQFLDSSSTRTELGEISSVGERPESDDVIAAASRLLEERGVELFAFDTTSPDVADAGLHVVRVVSPELCRLDASHTARFLGNPRLYRTAHELGLRPALTREEDVNPFPHPFP